MPIRTADYPQCHLPARNLNADATLAEPDAFALYEREWRWGEVVPLLPHEQALIVRLTQTYCNGGLHV